MHLNPTQSSPDYFIDEQQLDFEDSDFPDPYIATVMAEMQDSKALEDIGFQDYLDIFQSNKYI